MSKLDNGIRLREDIGPEIVIVRTFIDPSQMELSSDLRKAWKRFLEARERLGTFSAALKAWKDGRADGNLPTPTHQEAISDLKADFEAFKKSRRTVA